MGLWYPRESPFDLEAFSDSDYGGSNLDRKSTTGGCQFLGQRLISWQCKKQTIVATSTTEAEYVAAANCCGQVLWVQNQLLDYGFNFMNTKIHIDNESTICIVKNPVYHSKTKHIEIRHHFIRDCYEKKLISVEKIHTDLNVADLPSMDAREECQGGIQTFIAFYVTCLLLGDAKCMTRTWSAVAAKAQARWPDLSARERDAGSCARIRPGGYRILHRCSVCTGLTSNRIGGGVGATGLVWLRVLNSRASRSVPTTYIQYLTLNLHHYEHIYDSNLLVHHHISPHKNSSKSKCLMDDLLHEVPKFGMGIEMDEFGLSDSEEEEPGSGGKSQDDPLDSSQYKDSGFTEEVDTVLEQVNTAEGVNTGSIKLSTVSEQLSTGDEQVSTVGTKESTSSQDKDKEKGKAQMLMKKHPKKSKEQILQEEASLAEAIRLDSLQKEEEAKQIHLDSHLFSKNMQREEFKLINIRKRKAQVQFEAQHYTNEDLGFEFRAKIFESFAPINFEATKANLKRFGEKLQTKTSKRLKDDEAKDDEPTKKSGKRRKQIARKGLHTSVDKNDSEIQMESWIVMNRYGMDGPEDELEKGFWKCLKTMFEEPLSTDPIWSELGQQKIISWRYYDTCRVHCLNLESMDVYMLSERKYPLSAEQAGIRKLVKRGGVCKVRKSRMEEEG
ncbi:hypothetical protein Tco_0799663 [Tanacetum coccineum]|uniref:Uncharacterized protein n=1 Tax=Tanacetum coccineum TaxID=301880 RepID=A0ABQ4ZUN4_9ASTR